jgi:hypothetical protein
MNHLRNIPEAAPVIKAKAVAITRTLLHHPGRPAGYLANRDQVKHQIPTAKPYAEFSGMIP